MFDAILPSAVSKSTPRPYDRWKAQDYSRAFRITRGLAVEMMYVFSMAELLSFMAKLVHGQIRASTR